MDENHQDKAGSKLVATEGKILLPPLSPKGQEQVDQLRKKQKRQKKAVNKWRWGFSDKTGWDYLQLLLQLLTALALPIALFLAAQWFSAQQGQASELANEHQHQTDLQIAADQQRETTLQTYLDQMSDLLLNHPLLKSKLGDEVRQVARERTLTTLRRLDADRNMIVLQFLQDAHLIGEHNAIIDLSGTNLSGVDLSRANLSRANLSGADLRNATLSRATLNGAFLNYAHLNGANLSGANLSGANLSGAFLSGAFLFNANLRNATLSGATLNGADLRNATLLGANLSGAFLSHANLSGVDLTDAILTDAILRGATMPDGSKHP